MFKKETKVKNQSTKKSLVAKSIEENKGDKLNITNVEKKQNNNFIKKNTMVKSKITMILIITIIVVLMALIVGGYLYFNNSKQKPYTKYEEKVITYGFDKMYNNGNSKTSESVTKSEALKIAISTTLNLNDISGIQNEPTEKYSNAIWVAFAKSKEIISKDEITKENTDEKATYIDVIRYFSNAKVKLLNKNLDTQVNSNIKDYNIYKSDEQMAIADAINNGIIKEKTDKLDGYKKVFKGQVNEIIINYVEKYNTIAPLGEKLNIDPEKIPSNANDYPYTLAGVDKAVYEKEFFVEDKEKFKNSIVTYKEKKENFDQMIETAQNYYNTLLNIDYNTINEEEFKLRLEDYVLNGVSSEKMNKYIKYVKDNKIKITGSAKAQSPIFYFDGVNYRLRVKLEYKIINSYTKENLFYGDLIFNTYNPVSKAMYEKNESTIYVDAVFGGTKMTNSLYIIEKPIYITTVDRNNSGIVFESVEE